MTDVRKPIGFRRTTVFAHSTIPWRFWIGPLLVARLHVASLRPEVQIIRDLRYAGVSWLGLNVSVFR